MRDARELTRVFKALSVEARVRIVEMLKGRSLCVGALSARLNMTQGAVSQHLRILRDVDLVVPERRGYFVHYGLNEETLCQWREAIGGLLTFEESEEGGCVGSEARSGRRQVAPRRRSTSRRRARNRRKQRSEDACVTQKRPKAV